MSYGGVCGIGTPVNGVSRLMSDPARCSLRSAPAKLSGFWTVPVSATRVGPFCTSRSIG